MALEAILIVDLSHLQIALYPFDAHLNLLLPLFRIGGGERQKGPPYQFFPCNFCKRWNKPPKTFWLLVLTLQSKIIELKPRPPLKKSGFSGQILLKLRLWKRLSERCYSYKTLVTCPHLQYSLSQVIKCCWSRHSLELWRHQLYFEIFLISEALEKPILLTSSKL